MRIAGAQTAGKTRLLSGVQCWAPAFRFASAGATGLFALAACATPGTYDLKPAYLAAVPEATSTYLDCDGVTDIVCECRKGGLEQEFPKPSLTDFDAGYAVLAAEIDNGATHAEAETKAINAVFAEVTKDIEDICSYHEGAE